MTRKSPNKIKTPPVQQIQQISQEIPLQPVMKVSQGAGITEGLELWLYGMVFFLHDRSPDGRFAVDVNTWNSALSLNANDVKHIKNATQ